MTTPFDTLWNAAAGSLFLQHFGDTFSVRRGALVTTGVVAQKFLDERAMVVDDTGATKITKCVWVISKAAYAINGTAVTPRSGDRIIEPDAQEWEVSPTEEYAEYADLPGGIEWRLMTKRV